VPCQHTAKHYEVSAAAKGFGNIARHGAAAVADDLPTEAMRRIGTLDHGRELWITDTRFNACSADRTRADTDFYNISAREDQLFTHLTGHYVARDNGFRWPGFTRLAYELHEVLGVTVGYVDADKIQSRVGGKLAAALAAGCTAVIKPSEMSALQTQIVTEALHDAGLPPGVFNIVTGRGDTVGDTIARHPDVAKISFTGSTQTGKAILRNAADSFKRVTLELGGKSPTLILEDADLTQAIPLAVQAGFMNSGQACVAGTRILVPQSREAECEAALAQAVMAVKSGSPRDPDTVIGPMVSFPAGRCKARYWIR
jgi:acyl-CoA reductase-like NAD-dependent aldehyde dehydrogenase